MLLFVIGYFLSRSHHTPEISSESKLFLGAKCSEREAKRLVLGSLAGSQLTKAAALT
jgi:hypothetical protein